MSCVVVEDTVVKAACAGLAAGGGKFSSLGGCGHRESGQEVNHPALCQPLVWACLVLGGICFILHSCAQLYQL